MVFHDRPGAQAVGGDVVDPGLDHGWADPTQREGAEPGSTSSSAPVIAAARLRKGTTNSARGADRFVADALITARKAGATGTSVMRADSAFYGHDVIAATLRQGDRSSITARQVKAVRIAISTITQNAWTTIKYTNAIFDDASGSSTGHIRPTSAPALIRRTTRDSGH